ncbi:AAA family ATPase [Hamadaea tsunoensis]|uniref:AAA family ATPase n=1 Tax=Hamadaea tsunoensis TaxID=53368 RepID=UPI00042656D3|nr:SMC family ATPase [Hamadaea tsunoensis]
MRPLRLDLRGFTVFREPTVVDLTDADFFALVGPTGAGKSTLLDAICFALYGQVPRWSGKTVANALAPSSVEAAVRMIFESGGRRYAVSRVVRRDGKGRVATKHAGLQLLPNNFNPASLDGGEPIDELGQILAGTPNELDGAVVDVVGLPYDQFIKCILLPQGEFAAFLHAKPAERQEILVKLLGLEVYDKIREKAAEREKAAVNQLAATERVLAEATEESSDERLADAEDRVTAVRDLADRLAAEAPRLTALDARRQAAVEKLATLDGQLAALGRIRPDAGAVNLAGAADEARQRVSAAAEVLTAAEEAEEKARARLATTADPAETQAFVKSRQDLAAGLARQKQGAAALAKAQEEHDTAVRDLDRVRGVADSAATALGHAQQVLEDARNTDRVAVLRPLLHAGEACMVCEQIVTTLPQQRSVGATVAAQDRLKQARAAAEKAEAARGERDQAARETDRRLASVRAKVEELAQQVARIQEALATAPSDEELAARLAVRREAETDLERSTVERKQAAERQRAAQTQLQRAEDQLRSAWRVFDAARDTVAPIGTPPPVERDDLRVAWQVLADWAATTAGKVGADRAAAEQAVAEASRTEQELLAKVAEWFRIAEVMMPKEIAGLEKAVTIAVERAAAGRERVLDARRRADDLRQQRAAVEADKVVAAMLAQHLKANNFEAWLLEEALDALVLGASTILQELSGGQYDLVHRAREFYVVDHHDAGLTRAVRTLSGGETFQASLALALALADQLAGLAHTASLESILLDEGFGTLDSATLDTVAATLENLAARGDRMVGVVTHVAALAERIPVRFEVRKDGRSARVDRIG